MNRYLLMLLLSLLTASLSFAQASEDKVNGTIMDEGNNPVPFASVVWENNNTVGTTSDEQGKFSLPRVEGANAIVVSFMGYETQTVSVKSDSKFVIVTLKSKDVQLDDVAVVARKKTEVISKRDPLKVEKLTSASMETLPCCHLAAVFENSLSVDKTYTDAVTGTEEIKMLGLAGKYTQILSEELPLARGLSSSFGMNVPGPFLKSVSISKGIGSVISGYEGITGQIQLFMKQPEDSERFFFNLYGDSNGSTDINLYKGIEIGKNKKWNSMLLVHGSNHWGEHDKNHDGFLDNTKGEKYNITQTFKYNNEGKYRHQFGYRFMYKESIGGEKNFKESRDRGTKNHYGVGINSRRFEVFSNQMFRIKNLEGFTFGLKTNFANFERDAYFGLQQYRGKENNFNTVLNIEKSWKKLGQKLNFGASFMYDEYNESLNKADFDREEIVPGLFTEYTVKPSEKITFIAGLRGDYHNEYDLFITPRFHFKYNFSDRSVFRLLAGKGYRTANVIMDNMGFLASSRQWKFKLDEKDLLEESWSYGASLSHTLSIGAQDFNVELDYYRTEFENKVITDLYSNPKEINFTALDGESFANSVQAQVSFEPFNSFSVKMAGRYNEVKETYNGKLQDQYYNSKFKGLLTFSYATNFSKWQFDMTNQFIGKAKLPYLKGGKYENYSPAFYQLHMQVTRRFKKFDIYLAAENLTNYKQDHPIISADDPFSENFDATRIWGPVSGVKIAGGIRLKIK
jgi:hypothetical protein